MKSKKTIDVDLAEWSAPSHVNALTTFRTGGVSKDTFSSLNLATHVGDDPTDVSENRARLMGQLMLPSEPIWLRQIHGNRVVKADPIERNSIADGSYTTDPGTVCAVLTADCIPLFLTNFTGTVICLLHVGWRGLAAGVIENGIEVVNVKPEELLAWIGPGIGPDAFVVGDEVREKLTRQCPEHHYAFEKHRGRWLANLGQMVEQRLVLAGLKSIDRSKYCTSRDSLAWFSYRRDGHCGRMASLIWMNEFKS